MGVEIASEVWQLNPSLYLFIIVASFLSIFILPHFSNRTTSSSSDINVISSSLSFKFQRKFLVLYSLSSVLEGLWLVYGEYEIVNYGLNKQQMIVLLSSGCLASLVLGTLLGIFSDALGHKKFCLLFSILHLIMAVWKTLAAHPAIWVASICLSLASSIFSFSFESWMVVEHDKQGYRQDALNDTFWLMSFFESTSLILSQVLANWALGHGSMKGLISSSVITMLLASVNLAFTIRGWPESSAQGKVKEHRAAFTVFIFGDKRVWLLGCAQACLHFSAAVFWIVWAPTIVADGREVQLGFIYPCFLGARMLGSTTFPWTLSGLLSLRIEDCLLYEFIAAGVILSIVAYDYQEIGVFVALFCLFQAVAGLILPTLARLRTMYVPNEFRAGMISLSLAPANAAILCVLIQGGYYRNVNNSTITAFAALGLFLAAGCMYMLKHLGKQPHQSWHKQ
ncbi:molybdate-anion transporter-like [Chenopodium quinoa]|uniref:Molybdate-anion transporter-like n=1 Tax=Chenopodium quinoa TaxID=63459 RepID=A0A803N4F7_CHEQI|nr:molybdate-anion transporter-like [Chenopodium quinoa]